MTDQKPIMRKIDPGPFARHILGRELRDPGAVPVLQWIPISLLWIDVSYQRDILANGIKNVVAIALNFNWQMFGAIVIAEVPRGYAIIDGQHRTTGAALRGIKEVPCLIVDADQAAQAAAFAAINSNVTRMNSHQIFLAKVAAGDRSALEVKAACDAAGVQIVKSSSNGFAGLKRGETAAASWLLSLHRAFGSDILTLALRCISGVGDGNPGMLRPKIMKAVCCVLESEPAWARDEARLLAAFSTLSFADRLVEAEIWARQRKIAVDAAFSYFIAAHLEKQMVARAA